MELWDLYTKEREKTGKTMMRGEAVPDGYYRFVVHICIFNDNGEMLIQKRQTFKSGWSGLWDVSVGGSAIAGDTSSQAAARELREELGIEHSFEHICPSITYAFKNAFDDVYIIKKNVDITKLRLQYEEVEAVKWANADEIKRMIDSGEFIPYHKSYIDMLFFRKDSIDMTVREDK